jgi:single-strand DNA-binding protein
MASLNKVMLIGNLTRDPDVRYTPKGSAVADLGIAVNRTYMTESNERMQETTYIDVVVWSHLAELAGKYLHKGRAVFIEGRLQMDTWVDKATDQKRTKLRVVADNLQFLDSKREGGQGGEEGGHSEGAPPRSYGGSGSGGGGGGGGNTGGGFQRSARPMGGGGGGSSGGYPQRNQAQPPRQAPQQNNQDDFGDGPITDGLDDDEIPF